MEFRGWLSSTHEFEAKDLAPANYHKLSTYLMLNRQVWNTSLSNFNQILNLAICRMYIYRYIFTCVYIDSGEFGYPRCWCWNGSVPLAGGISSRGDLYIDAGIFFCLGACWVVCGYWMNVDFRCLKQILGRICLQDALMPCREKIHKNTMHINCFTMFLLLRWNHAPSSVRSSQVTW